MNKQICFVRTLSLAIVVLTVIAISNLPANAAWTPGTILVAHKTTSESHAITQLDANGHVVRQFGIQSTDEFRSHLAISGGILYRMNEVFVRTLDQFSDDGSLIRSIPIIPPGDGTFWLGHFMQIASDFADTSIYLAGPLAPTHTIFHLDDLSPGTSGTSSIFTELFAVPSLGDLRDLYFGGPIGNETLFALLADIPADNAPGHIAKIDVKGNYVLFSNPELIFEFLVDIGSLAADPVGGNIYVATGKKILKFDPSGNLLDSYPFITFKPSLGIDKGGNLYLGLFESGTISVLSPAGKLIKNISIPDATQIVDVLIVPEVPPLEVLVDIKPGNSSNTFNLNSAGMIPVAILSSATFDARTVLPETIRLSGARVRLIGKGDGFACNNRDVNQDGFTDLECNIETDTLIIEPGTAMVDLEALTIEGIRIRGHDAITIVLD